jgi:hypothetical protein
MIKNQSDKRIELCRSGVKYNKDGSFNVATYHNFKSRLSLRRKNTKLILLLWM